MEISLKEFYFALICFNFIMVPESRYCSWSIGTVEQVASCPLNKAEVEQRKQRKNCEALAKLQNCTEPQNFLYHCVINDLENALVEVCAPAYIMNGYCAEFNMVGALIQQHFNLKCSNVKPQCAARYNSRDAYLYQGCYDVVKNESSSSYAPLTTTSSSTNDNTLEKQGDELEIAAVIGITVGVLIFIIIIVIVLAFLMNWRNKNRTNGGTNDDAEKSEMLPATERPVHFMAPYDHVFVETNVSRECSKKLKEKGIVFLTGKQGSGKTATAIHVLNENEYKKWKTNFITSREELEHLRPVPKGETLVFIDNLFDRYEYCKEVKDWWNIIWQFYFQYIKEHNNVRLIITVKDGVMKKARVFLDVYKQTLLHGCSLDANDLSEEEKTDILEAQFKLANELKKTNYCFYKKHHQQLIPTKPHLIGFPLCAHMYAFENDDSTRDESITNCPSTYVLQQIDHELKEDKSNGVKTLFLLLLFQFSKTGLNSLQTLDLKSERECINFLKHNSSEEMLREIGPLSYRNLHKKAKALKGKFLLNNNDGYAFKHQIYLDGVSNYFFRKYFNSVVQFFPFDILQPCVLPDRPPESLQILMERLIKELEKRHFYEVLSREIFQDPQFEKQFCEQEKTMPFLEPLLGLSDATSAFGFRIIFWACKYNLPKLEKEIMTLAEKNEKDFEFQFYLAMFGECCGVDEMYIRSTSSTSDISQLQEAVYKFKTSEEKTIFHLLVSSEKSDYDAHRFLKKLLDDSQGTILDLDKSIVDCTLRQAKRSRLMCLIEILNRLKGTNKSAGLGDHYIQFDGFVNDSENDTYYGLECLCRICILYVYGEYSFSENMVGFLKCDISDEEEIKERMTSAVRKCLSSLQGNSSVPETKIPPMPEITPADWRKAITESIQILSNQEKSFYSECNKKTSEMISCM